MSWNEGRIGECARTQRPGLSLRFERAGDYYRSREKSTHRIYAFSSESLTSFSELAYSPRVQGRLSSHEPRNWLTFHYQRSSYLVRKSKGSFREGNHASTATPRQDAGGPAASHARP